MLLITNINSMLILIPVCLIHEIFPTSIQYHIVLSLGGTKTGKELIKNVYYKQYMPMSGDVSSVVCHGCQ